MDCTRVTAAGDPTPRPGDTNFHTEITVVGAEPVIATGAFPARFAADLRAIRGDALDVVPGSVVLVRGARQVVPVVGRSWYGGTETRNVPAWGLALAGQLATSGAWSRDDLDRAISRALFATTRWTGEIDPAYRDKIPRDGGAFLTRFQSGGVGDGSAVVVSARTSLSPVVVPAPASTRCTVYPQDRFWLRPRATFTRTGPEYPPGTALTVLSDTGQRQGSLGLYAVEVGDRSGFAALSATDLQGCATVAPPPVASRGVCANFTPSRAFDFYEQVVEVENGVPTPRLVRRSLPRWTRVLLRKRLVRTVPGFGMDLEFFVVKVREGAYANRNGLAAFAPEELGCNPATLPTYTGGPLI